MLALAAAERAGMTQATSEKTGRKTRDPVLRRLTGAERAYGKALGVGNDCAVRPTVAVGNYGETFERNLDRGSPLAIALDLVDMALATLLGACLMIGAGNPGHGGLRRLGAVGGRPAGAALWREGRGARAREDRAVRACSPTSRWSPRRW